MFNEINVNYSSKLILNIRKLLFSLQNFICQDLNCDLDLDLDLDSIRHSDHFTLENVFEIQKKCKIHIPLINKLSGNSLLKFKFVKCRNLFVVGTCLSVCL